MIICNNCKTSVEDGVKFCTSCGMPVGETAAASDAKGETSEVKKFFKRFEIAKGSERPRVISNFIVPDTKEELLEFMIMASTIVDYSRIGTSGETAADKAWLVKIQQAYKKGKTVFMDDANALARITEIHEEVNEAVQRGEERRRHEESAKRKKTFKKLAIAAFIILVIIVLYYRNYSTAHKEEARLNTVYGEITSYIENGDLAAARLKADALKWEGNTDMLWGLSGKWKGKRDAILKEIEAKENQSKN